ncbi:MAG: hypothetical protein ACRDT2_16745, partial [Natronosporangium sp.]
MTAGAGRRRRNRFLLVAAGAVAARIALSAARSAARPSPVGVPSGGSVRSRGPRWAAEGWARTNYRGRT